MLFAAFAIFCSNFCSGLRRGAYAEVPVPVLSQALSIDATCDAYLLPSSLRLRPR